MAQRKEENSFGLSRTASTTHSYMRIAAPLPGSTAVRVAGLCFLLCDTAIAQTVPALPNSGQILQDLGTAPPLQTPLPRPRTPDVASRDATLAPEVPLAAQTRIDVRGYQVSDNTVFSDEELLKLVATQTGPMTIAQIEEVAANITRYYRQNGYMVARAYLPYQEIRGGVVTLAILEGRYGQIQTRNSTNISDRRILATVERAACDAAGCTGQLIRETPLEKGMLRLGDLPGITVRGELQPGTQVGTADLIVTAEPTRRFTGALDVSDYGGRYVGSERATLSLGLSNPIGFGDQLNLQGAYSSGSSYASLGYDFPLNYRGTRMFLSGYRMDYELEDDFQALGAQGDTTGGEVGLLHTFLRDSRRSVSGRATYSHKSIEDEIAVAGTSNQRKADTYVAQLDGALNDAWFGRSALTRLSIAYTTGKLEINDPLSLAIDDATARTDGSFDKAVYWLSRSQQLTQRWSVYIRVNGQVASQNLDSSEKFYLGGPNAVRAYPVGEAAGDRGYLASAELRRVFDGPFAGTSQLAMFYDRGQVRIDAQPWTLDSGTRTLDGQGVSLDWSHPYGWSLSATVAFRGSEVVQSGPDRDYQVWLAGGFRF